MNSEQVDNVSPQDELVRALGELLAEQRFAVLATQGHPRPHLSLMAFAATDDLRELIFPTDRGTRKFANMLAHAGAALLVDNRSNELADTEKAMAVTAEGRVEELAGNEREAALRLFLDRHPQLQSFARSATCALMRLRVQSYEVVRRFEQVEELRLSGS
jgi:nitroimidazol reductase NimA-like FMN-containing flavoprotein (pyridoxamine 5'-phosphate oxidase superfamily)